MKFQLAVLTALLLISCKSQKQDELVQPIRELYDNGLASLEKRKYNDAAKEFGQIFLQHPGNPLTAQAELMHSYSLFLAAEYDEAVDVLNIFIKLHPAHIDTSYAYYLKGLCNYMQLSNINLDQSKTSAAKVSFEEVITKFPNTKYAVDAALKIDLIDDHLAGKEMDIGRYYLVQRNPMAAILRFQHVTEQYSTTSHAKEALYRLVLAYKILGLDEEAKKYASILGYNYQSSKWYQYAYNLLSQDHVANSYH